MIISAANLRGVGLIIHHRMSSTYVFCNGDFGLNSHLIYEAFNYCPETSFKLHKVFPEGWQSPASLICQSFYSQCVTCTFDKVCPDIKCSECPFFLKISLLILHLFQRLEVIPCQDLLRQDICHLKRGYNTRIMPCLEALSRHFRKSQVATHIISHQILQPFLA